MQTTRSATSLLGLGEVGEVLLGRLVEIDDAVGQAAADGDLVHVDVGRVEKAAMLGHGDDGQCIGQALGGDGGALQRIEGDVDLGHAALAQADLLADIEHRRLVALALADHHGASMASELSVVRMASTAAWSAIFSSPRPISLEAARPPPR
jgi:hypothetical protein